MQILLMAWGRAGFRSLLGLERLQQSSTPFCMEMANLKSHPGDHLRLLWLTCSEIACVNTNDNIEQHSRAAFTELHSGSNGGFRGFLAAERSLQTG